MHKMKIKTKSFVIRKKRDINKWHDEDCRSN